MKNIAILFECAILGVLFFYQPPAKLPADLRTDELFASTESVDCACEVCKCETCQCQPVAEQAPEQADAKPVIDALPPEPAQPDPLLAEMAKAIIEIDPPPPPLPTVKPVAVVRTRQASSCSGGQCSYNEPRLFSGRLFGRRR